MSQYLERRSRQAEGEIMSVDAKRVQAVFLAAVEIADAAQRTTYLDQQCNSDPELRQRVEALLQAHETPASILAGPVVAPLEVTPSGTLPLDASANQALPFTGKRAHDSATLDAGANEDDGPSPLEILQPSTKPGSLGRLGHYEVLEVLGQGAFGTVVRAYDEKLQRMIAIKMMSPRLAATSPARKRFMREARSSAAIRHENVVDIHAIEEQPIPFLVMEYVAGETLQQRLDRVGPLDTLEVLRIGVQIAHGLAAAHAMGKIHRDIKPANILLENGVDRVKITDFGLARAADDASLTQSGLIAGTPMYMAPEQAQGVALDHRADLFSFGSVLYVMCSGRPPFRASTTLAVLKRVADDTPRSIREIIPEVPEWLCDIITKLHAKNPEDRFQTAQEVADVLGKYLTELQQHGKVNQESGVRSQGSGENKSMTAVAGAAPAGDIVSLPTAKNSPRHRGRRLAVAAAVLLCLVGSLAFTEATGVTKLRSSVIRIFTPDGTLVVEADDPGVKVTVEGDGGLVITGAGLEEIRLRPGSYKVLAERDGKRVALDRELVSISKGGREVVKVKLETPPALLVAKTAKGDFVLLAAGKERKFDTLAEAVLTASDGDTIEVRGNGPFSTEPLRITTALTIRAGPGFRPVIRLSPEILPGQGGWVAEAPLGLEGLELQCTPRPKKEGDAGQILLEAKKGLYAANCRFLMRRLSHFTLGGAWPCELHNCEILCSEGAYAIMIPNLQPGQRLVMENCLFAGLQVWQPDSHQMDEEEGRVRLTRNTFRTAEGHVWLHLIFAAVPDLKQLDESVKAMRVEASGNVFDTGAVLEVGHTLPPEKFPLADVLRLLRRHFEWKGERNVYAVDGWFGRGPRPEKHWQPIAEMKGLDDWRRFWGTTEAGSAEGRVRYEGGDLLARLATEPDKLTPEDFRLRADSAGYRAGKDGKDLGADVELVGPGAAYERWKKTPDYQQWLKDTALLRARAPRPEPGAFVRLGGPGVAERRFDTLAEAVRAASDGDTIEVRGNGPFVTQSIALGKQGLTIRAAAGYRPVITGTATHRHGDEIPYLLHTQSRLVLEGLELHLTGPSFSRTVGSLQAPLHVANCRFVLHGGCSILAESPVCTVRNCEFAGSSEGGAPHVFWQLSTNGKLILENNLFSDPSSHGIGLDWVYPDLNNVAIHLNHNTVVSSRSVIQGLVVVPESAGPLAAPGRQPVQLHASANLFDPIGRSGERNFSLLLTPGWHREDAKPLSAEEVERLLPRLMAWREERNLYRKGMGFQEFSRLKDPGGPKREFINEPLPAGRTFADWQRLWKTGDSGSAEGVIKYEGGNMLTKVRGTPERATPADFRLRHDSAGSRAGKDKKDLGADVDLVGPGAAYERWKKTPEYQQWLKDIGQVKK